MYVGNTRSSDGLTIITSSVGIPLFSVPNPRPLDGMNIGITSMKILLFPTPKYPGNDLLEIYYGGRSGCGEI